MSERMYLFVCGIYTLSALYVGEPLLIYVFSAFLMFEGLTDIRLTNYIQYVRGVTMEPGLFQFETKQRINIDTFRAVRMSIAAILSGSYIMVNEYNLEILWFFPWFMGFAIMGAGASGVCPLMLGLRWVGFK